MGTKHFQLLPQFQQVFNVIFRIQQKSIFSKRLIFLLVTLVNSWCSCLHLIIRYFLSEMIFYWCFYLWLIAVETVFCGWLFFARYLLLLLGLCIVLSCKAYLSLPLGYSRKKKNKDGGGTNSPGIFRFFTLLFYIFTQLYTHYLESQKVPESLVTIVCILVVFFLI